MASMLALIDNWKVVLGSLAACGVGLFWISFLATPRKTGIPGPNGLPLIGNAHQMPPVRPWLTFSTWKKLYGEYD